MRSTCAERPHEHLQLDSGDIAEELPCEAYNGMGLIFVPQKAGGKSIHPDPRHE